MTTVHSPTQHARSSRDLATLTRLRELRVEAALRERHTREQAMHERQQVVDAREHEIEQLVAARQRMARWAAGEGATDIGRVSHCMAGRCLALAHDLEMARLTLTDERQDLAAATKALEDSRAAWLHARRRQEALAAMALGLSRSAAREAEHRAERETEAPTPRESTALAR